MPSTNITMLQIVADGLEELKDEMVFVGGSVAELYANDPAASDIRPTLDVDCVNELSSRMAYDKLEENLRAKGFAHDTSPNAPSCRKIYKTIKVDVMPDDEKILGFSNKWYHEGIENKITKTLPNGTKIFVFPPEYYVAAKFEAHKDRGGNDLRQSHDFEDIIYILDNCPDLMDNINKANASVKAYLKEECLNLINNPSLSEGIESALPYGSDSDRVEIIGDIIREIAEIV
jgi:predicted nucleotidyltransferase